MCLCIMLIPFFAGDATYGATDQQKVPKAVFQSIRFTFEPVLEGDIIKHEFIVENQGNAPLVIKNIRPD